MSLRMLTRVVILALALVLTAPLFWSLAGPAFGLAGLALLILAAGYLTVGSRPAPASRWQIRYVLGGDDDLDRLNGILSFLAGRADHVVLEAGPQGLFLEAPPAFDAYIGAQVPLALPRATATRVQVGEGSSNNNTNGGYLCLSAPASEHLRWATDGAGRLARLHLSNGPYVTLAAASDGSSPPGRWVRVPLLRPGSRLWRRLPVWDELSAGVTLGTLFPATGTGAVYSSDSPVLALVPPADYRPDDAGRPLGQAIDGRPLTLPFSLPLFTVAAPAPFMARQVAVDVQRGCAVVVVSPHRRTLDLVYHEARQSATCRWLDLENSRQSTHLAVVTAGEWDDDGSRAEIAVRAVESFLADLGLDTTLPAVRSVVGALIRLLAGSAWQTAHDFSIGDLYAVSQGAQILKAFLADLQEMAHMEPGTDACLRQLVQEMSSDAGYVQVVSVLTALRGVLAPLKATSLQALCQPPFTPASELLAPGSLLLVPMTGTDFPEHNRFLAAVLDLVLGQARNLRLAVHLHDPQRYRADRGCRWIDAARKDGQPAVVVDTHDPDAYGHVVIEGQQGEMFFRCSEKSAATLAVAGGLTCPLSDLIDLPPGLALARLPGLLASAKVDG